MLYAQHPSPARVTGISYNDNCQRNTNYSPAQRKKQFPFNQAISIKVISFEEGLLTLSDKGVLDIVSPDPKIIDPGSEDSSRVLIKDSLELTTLQIDRLTDILFNYGYIRHSGSSSTVECYSPRHAILFMDKEDKPFAFIEICFECRNTRVSDDNISLGVPCTDKLLLIRKLFKDAGVKYGID
jgi:hypothetical protein